MTHHNDNVNMLKTPYLRPVWLPTAVTAVLLLVVLGLLVGMSWRSLQRLEPLHAHLAKLGLLQRTVHDIEELLIGQLANRGPADPQRTRQVSAELAQVEALEPRMEPQTLQMLESTRQVLGSVDGNSRDVLLSGLTTISNVLEVETRAHEDMVAEARRDTEFEFRIAAATLVLLPLVGLVIVFLLRRRIFNPLNELGLLMTLLARQDYSLAASHPVDPVLKPLFDNYNQLVSRLAVLEAQNRARQQSLENQVRAATHALLEQQRELAAAERLAAVGEVAAGLAHELRNPLAGVQLALNNISQEIDEPEHSKRLALLVNELNRVAGLLNGMLSQTKQEPEAPRDIQLAATVTDLLTLVSYQVGENIVLLQEIPADLVCRLPAGRLHQALLNVVLNGAQAIGEQSGRIVVRGEGHGNQVVLSVCDDGPGFPVALLEGGIRPFATGRVGGTGLGLVVVQRFTRDLGGSLQLENREPHGACVILTLPCKGRDG